MGTPLSKVSAPSGVEDKDVPQVSKLEIKRLKRVNSQKSNHSSSQSKRSLRLVSTSNRSHDNKRRKASKRRNFWSTFRRQHQGKRRSHSKRTKSKKRKNVTNDNHVSNNRNTVSKFTFQHSDMDESHHEDMCNVEGQYKVKTTSDVIVDMLGIVPLSGCNGHQYSKVADVEQSVLTENITKKRSGFLNNFTYLVTLGSIYHNLLKHGVEHRGFDIHQSDSYKEPVFPSGDKARQLFLGDATSSLAPVKAFVYYASHTSTVQRMDRERSASQVSSRKRKYRKRREEKEIFTDSSSEVLRPRSLKKPSARRINKKNGNTDQRGRKFDNNIKVYSYGGNENHSDKYESSSPEFTEEMKVQDECCCVAGRDGCKRKPMGVVSPTPTSDVKRMSRRSTSQNRKPETVVIVTNSCDCQQCRCSEDVIAEDSAINVTGSCECDLCRCSNEGVLDTDNSCPCDSCNCSKEYLLQSAIENKEDKKENGEKPELLVNECNFEDQCSCETCYCSSGDLQSDRASEYRPAKDRSSVMSRNDNLSKRKSRRETAPTKRKSQITQHEKEKCEFSCCNQEDGDGVCPCYDVSECHDDVVEHRDDLVETKEQQGGCFSCCFGKKKDPERKKSIHEPKGKRRKESATRKNSRRPTKKDSIKPPIIMKEENECQGKCRKRKFTKQKSVTVVQDEKLTKRKSSVKTVEQKRSERRRSTKNNKAYPKKEMQNRNKEYNSQHQTNEETTETLKKTHENKVIKECHCRRSKYASPHVRKSTVVQDHTHGGEERRVERNVSVYQVASVAPPSIQVIKSPRNSKGIQTEPVYLVDNIHRASFALNDEDIRQLHIQTYLPVREQLARIKHNARKYTSKKTDENYDIISMQSSRKSSVANESDAKRFNKSKCKKESRGTSRWSQGSLDLKELNTLLGSEAYKTRRCTSVNVHTINPTSLPLSSINDKYVNKSGSIKHEQNNDISSGYSPTKPSLQKRGRQENKSKNRLSNSSSSLVRSSDSVGKIRSRHRDRRSTVVQQTESKSGCLTKRGKRSLTYAALEQQSIPPDVPADYIGQSSDSFQIESVVVNDKDRSTRQPNLVSIKTISREFRKMVDSASQTLHNESITAKSTKHKKRTSYVAQEPTLKEENVLNSTDLNENNKNYKRPSTLVKEKSLKKDVLVPDIMPRSKRSKTKINNKSKLLLIKSKSNEKASTSQNRSSKEVDVKNSTRLSHSDVALRHLPMSPNSSCELITNSCIHTKIKAIIGMNQELNRMDIFESKPTKAGVPVRTQTKDDERCELQLGTHNNVKNKEVSSDRKKRKSMTIKDENSNRFIHQTSKHSLDNNNTKQSAVTPLEDEASDIKCYKKNHKAKETKECKLNPYSTNITEHVTLEKHCKIPKAELKCVTSSSRQNSGNFINKTTQTNIASEKHSFVNEVFENVTDKKCYKTFNALNSWENKCDKNSIKNNCPENIKNSKEISESLLTSAADCVPKVYNIDKYNGKLKRNEKVCGFSIDIPPLKIPEKNTTCKNVKKHLRSRKKKNSREEYSRESNYSELENINNAVKSSSKDIGEVKSSCTVMSNETLILSTDYNEVSNEHSKHILQDHDHKKKRKKSIKKEKQEEKIGKLKEEKTEKFNKLEDSTHDGLVYYNGAVREDSRLNVGELSNKEQLNEIKREHKQQNRKHKDKGGKEGRKSLEQEDKLLQNGTFDGIVDKMSRPERKERKNSLTNTSMSFLRNRLKRFSKPGSKETNSLMSLENMNASDKNEQNQAAACITCFPNSSSIILVDNTSIDEVKSENEIKIVGSSKINNSEASFETTSSQALFYQKESSHKENTNESILSKGKSKLKDASTNTMCLSVERAIQTDPKTIIKSDKHLSTAILFGDTISYFPPSNDVSSEEEMVNALKHKPLHKSKQNTFRKAFFVFVDKNTQTDITYNDSIPFMEPRVCKKYNSSAAGGEQKPVESMNTAPELQSSPQIDTSPMTRSSVLENGIQKERGDGRFYPLDGAKIADNEGATEEECTCSSSCSCDSLNACLAMKKLFRPEIKTNEDGTTSAVQLRKRSHKSFKEFQRNNKITSPVRRGSAIIDSNSKTEHNLNYSQLGEMGKDDTTDHHHRQSTLEEHTNEHTNKQRSSLVEQKEQSNNTKEEPLLNSLRKITSPLKCLCRIQRKNGGAHPCSKPVRRTWEDVKREHHIVTTKTKRNDSYKESGGSNVLKAKRNNSSFISHDKSNSLDRDEKRESKIEQQDDNRYLLESNPVDNPNRPVGRTWSAIKREHCNTCSRRTKRESKIEQNNDNRYVLESNPVDNPNRPVGRTWSAVKREHCNTCSRRTKRENEPVLKPGVTNMKLESSPTRRESRSQSQVKKERKSSSRSMTDRNSLGRRSGMKKSRSSQGGGGRVATKCKNAKDGHCRRRGHGGRGKKPSALAKKPLTARDRRRFKASYRRLCTCFYPYVSK